MLKDIINTVDLATRQRLFFYELCKLGVVKFDLSNEIHSKVLTQIVDSVTKGFDEANYSNEPEEIQIELKNKNSLDLLIVQQLLANAVNK